jgi:hypothetical protein
MEEGEEEGGEEEDVADDCADNDRGLIATPRSAARKMRKT